jgi:hypothetical protein
MPEQRIAACFCNKLPASGLFIICTLGPELFLALDLHDLAVVHDDFERAETDAFQHLANLAHYFNVLIPIGTIFNVIGHAGTPCKKSCWSGF